MRRLPPPTPGEILLYEFLEPMGLSARELADAMGVPVDEVTELLDGRRVIDIDLNRRLCEYFGMSDRFWISLQNAYDRRMQNQS